ncbi:sugar kinase [Sphaerisporangium album]|uniref:Sugar kinase n=1 Tax=Sphaerisporangium album TaxID=509200 RepID=A0A367FBM6_9ACTN|nr:PfkB family carbohydrate kinase [Sphaerisporangium album]RCG27097.1 sugar kinase [Sphaerisporangium album]
MTCRGLFAGLCTLDLVQSVERMPGANEKVTALGQTVAAGGPAANAAVAFAHLGGIATLVSAVGAHPLAQGVLADLAQHGVRLADLTPDAAGPPAISTIMVTRGTGDRAVVSVNGSGVRVQPPPGLADLVAANHVVHLDGHHPDLALAAARLARERGRLTVLDGGSWKPGTAELLPYVDVAVVSGDFHPPGARTPQDVLAYLAGAGVRWTAVTSGGGAVLWRGGGEAPGEVRSHPVPRVDVVDTLGAGDVLHGALTFALCRALTQALGPVTGSVPGSGDPGSVTEAVIEDTFAAALSYAIPIASAACASFGTRAWIGSGGDGSPPRTHR